MPCEEHLAHRAESRDALHFADGEESALSSSTTVSSSTVLYALLRRDFRLARKELRFLLVRTMMQLVLFLIVFGFLLPKMGFMRGGYQTALLPGILAVSLALSAIQSVALPMVQDFGWTKEIEDRLLAPVPTWVVAAEKIAPGVVQGVIAAMSVLPPPRVIMVPTPNRTSVDAANGL